MRNINGKNSDRRAAASDVSVKKTHTQQLIMGLSQGSNCHKNILMPLANRRYSPYETSNSLPTHLIKLA